VTDTGVEALDRLAEALPKRDPHKKAKLNHVELPDGQKVSDLTGPELGRALKRLKVEGADPKASFETNHAVYEAFLRDIYDFAGELAILTWFQENKHGASSSDDDENEDED